MRAAQSLPLVVGFAQLSVYVVQSAVGVLELAHIVAPVSDTAALVCKMELAGRFERLVEVGSTAQPEMEAEKHLVFELELGSHTPSWLALD